MSKKTFVLTILAMILTTVVIITCTLTDHVDVLRGAGTGLLFLILLGGLLLRL